MLVVGAGESSSDIIAELVERKCDVTWSVPGPTWFASRTMNSRPAFQYVATMPADIWLVPGWRRILSACSVLEYHVRYLFVEKLIRHLWGENGHGMGEALEQSLPYLSQFVNKSRDAVVAVHQGKVKVQLLVQSCAGEIVTFQKGKQDQFDTIVECVGYKPDFSFLPKMFRPHRGEWYKKILSCRFNTLAFCGYARPVLGSIPSLSDMQAAWISHAWAGKISLPKMAMSFYQAKLADEADSLTFYDSSCLGVLCGVNSYAPLLAGDMERGDFRWWGLVATASWRKLFNVLMSPWNPRLYDIKDPAGVHRDLEDRMRHWREGLIFYLMPFYVALDYQCLLLALLSLLHLATQIDFRLVPAALSLFLVFYTFAIHLAVRMRWDLFLPSSMISLWFYYLKFPAGDTCNAVELKKAFNTPLKWHLARHAGCALILFILLLCGNAFMILRLLSFIEPSNKSS